MEKIFFSSPRLKIRKLLSDKIYSRAAVSNTRLEKSPTHLDGAFLKTMTETWNFESCNVYKQVVREKLSSMFYELNNPFVTRHFC